MWQRNANRANAFAQKIATAAGGALRYPCEGNEVFLTLGTARAEALHAAGFNFYPWYSEKSGQIRLVVSWDQPEEEVDALCLALSRL